MDKRFLIVGCLGNSAAAVKWLGTEAANFDSFIINIAADIKTGKDNKHKNTLAELATFYENMPLGNASHPVVRFEVISSVIEQYWELLATYDAFWFPPETLTFEAEAANRLFSLFEGHNLTLAQPALDGTEDNRVMRFVDSITATAPLMSRDALITLHPTFKSAKMHMNNWHSALDIKEPKSTKALAIIDTNMPCDHQYSPQEKPNRVYAELRYIDVES